MQAEIAATPEPYAAPAARAVSTPRLVGEVETVLIGQILWRRRRWIAAAAAIGFLGALGYSLVATPQYVAVAQLLIDPRDKQVVSNDVNPSSIAADGGVTQVESQGSVLQSNSVLLRAIAAEHLESDPQFNGGGLLSGLSGLFSTLTKAPDPAALAETSKARTLAALRKSISVKRADKVLVLDLAVRARTATRAAEIANAVADAYLADQAEARSASSREASKDLAGRLGELRSDVNAAETAVADYRAAHNFVVSSGQLVSDQEINQATAQLSAAQNRAASLKTQLDQLSRNPGVEGTPEAMASAVMARLRDRESGVVERLASASRQLGPLHPEIASLEQSLAEVRALIAKETRRLRQAAQVDYARAAQDEKALGQKLDAMKSKSLDDDRADVRLRELNRQADAARAIYQAYMVRARETLEASNVDTTNARIISRALPPLQKSWPPTILLILGATFVGLSLGAAGGLADEYLRPSLLTREHARERLGVPALGPSDGDGVALATLRALSLSEASEGPAHGRCLYLASPASADAGRARLAERIAALSAGEGRPTLLIEAGAAGDGQPGLYDFLRGESSLADLVYCEESEGFARLARGTPDPATSAPRGGDAFRLRRARRHYDLVIFDAGRIADDPRLAALAAEADHVLLVAALGARQADVQREVEAVQGAGATLDAVALVAT